MSAQVVAAGPPSAKLIPAKLIPANPAERANVSTWVAVIAGMIGAFMAILNIQITNASLLDIEGGIGTGVDKPGSRPPPSSAKAS
jgi:MFS transporter, DHA2 family, multidrug resistance protein